MPIISGQHNVLPSYDALHCCAKWTRLNFFADDTVLATTHAALPKKQSKLCAALTPV